MAPAKSQLSVQDLFKAKKPQTRLLFLSPDTFRKLRFIEKYATQFSLGDAVQKFDCGSLTKDKIQNLASDVSGGSLFYSRRYFIFNNIENLPAPCVEPLLSLIKGASPDDLILCTGIKLAAASPLYKYFHKETGVLLLEAPEGFELKRWIAKECERLGCKIAESAIQLIVNSVGEDLDKVAQYCELLSLLVEPGDTISEEVARTLLSSHGADNEFQLIEEISRGNLRDATALLHENLKNNKSPFGLVALLFRNIALMREIQVNLAAGVSEANVRAKLELSPWLFNKLSPLAKKAKPESISRALVMCMKVDSLLKNRSLKPEELFNEIIYETSH